MRIFVLVKDYDGNIEVCTYSTKEKAQEAFRGAFSSLAEDETKDDFFHDINAAAQMGYACFFGNYDIRIEESELDKD